MSDEAMPLDLEAQLTIGRRGDVHEDAQRSIEALVAEVKRWRKFGVMIIHGGRGCSTDSPEPGEAQAAQHAKAARELLP